MGEKMEQEDKHMTIQEAINQLHSLKQYALKQYAERHLKYNPDAQFFKDDTEALEMAIAALADDDAALRANADDDAALRANATALAEKLVKVIKSVLEEYLAVKLASRIANDINKELVKLNGVTNESD